MYNLVFSEFQLQLKTGAPIFKIIFWIIAKPIFDCAI
jgi:hypothetical protein